jgi:hypothetical protein
MKKLIFHALLVVLLIGNLIISACQPDTSISAFPLPVTEWQEIRLQAPLDDWLGPYAPERTWGNPREAISNDGWSFTYDTALTTPYSTGEDGIAALTDKQENALVNWAFYTQDQPYLTERLYGLSNHAGIYGETVLEDRVFLENTPTHSYMRYMYRYPYEETQSEITIEYAKLDGRSMIAQITIGMLENSKNSLIFVPEILSGTGDEVIRLENGTLVAFFDAGSMVIIPETQPQSWQITPNTDPQRGTINQAIVSNQTLLNEGNGSKAAWQYSIPAGSEGETLRFGIGYGRTPDLAYQRAKAALDSADRTLANRSAEAKALYRDEVSAYQDVYQAALMNLLWNKTYYQYDGSFQPQYEGKVDVHDVVLLPDKWEFPWIALWDSCFQINVAKLADINQAKNDLSLLLSDRWQNESGHVPSSEWDLDGETPPLLAWAAWQVYQQDGDKEYLRSLYPALEAHYAYASGKFDLDQDHLYTGGFMGMDNVPRPKGISLEQADLSGWMAFFADHMEKISTELGEKKRAAYYEEEYKQIAAAINEQLWDEDSGFYYDRDKNGLLLQKSYSGLIPFIAGVSSPAQTEDILTSLTDPAQFWSEYGIRSMPADSPFYESGYSASGWKNSNWRGPVWIPINYLLVNRVDEVDIGLGNWLREILITNIDQNWQQTGRFYEYYDAENGEGLGADHQTGWTALVANLIYEKYHQ